MSSLLVDPELSQGEQGLGFRPSRRRKIRPKHVVVGTLLVLISAFTFLPFLLVLFLALSPANAPTIPFQWPRTLTVDNIVNVLSAQNFARWTVNSFVYSTVSVVLILLTAAMAGYAFAKKRFPGRDVIFWSILATLMVPFQAVVIPTFVIVAGLKGIDTFWGLIVPTLANAQAVFLMRQFIQGIPDEFFDAARIDGANEWVVFRQLVLPMTRPILATLGIFVFLWHWNDFLWPLIVAQSSEMSTLTVGLASLNGLQEPVANLMAATAVSVVPCVIVFAVLQRFLVNSVVMSGLKG